VANNLVKGFSKAAQDFHLNFVFSRYNSICYTRFCKVFCPMGGYRRFVELDTSNQNPVLSASAGIPLVVGTLGRKGWSSPAYEEGQKKYSWIGAGNGARTLQ
jgi:hypothetical protein